MKQKKRTTDEIIRIIKEAASGKDFETVCRKHNISAASFYRWKKKFGGMELKDACEYQELEKKRTAGSRRCQADSLLKIRVLEEVNAKDWGVFCRSSAVRQNGGSARWAAAVPAGTVAAWAA